MTAQDTVPVVPAVRFAFSQLGLVFIDPIEGDEYRGEARIGDAALTFIHEEGLRVEVSETSLLLSPKEEGAMLVVGKAESPSDGICVEVWNIPSTVLSARQADERTQIAKGIYNVAPFFDCQGPGGVEMYLLPGLLVDLSADSRLFSTTLQNGKLVEGDELTFC